MSSKIDYLKKYTGASSNNSKDQLKKRLLKQIQKQSNESVPKQNKLN